MSCGKKPKSFSGDPYFAYPLHCKKAAGEAQFEEDVLRMASQFQTAHTVCLQGNTLTVAQVAAIARRPDVAVALAAAAKERVTQSADVHGVTTCFGETSKRRTDKTADLQADLVRFQSSSKAAMLVRMNTLMQGYSGTRWETLEAMTKLMNLNLIPKLPLRRTTTASGDLVPLSYIDGVFTGGGGNTAAEALRRSGVMNGPFELQAKEGLALVNGTAVASAVAATVCFDANVLTLLAKILSELYWEVMHEKPEFTDATSIVDSQLDGRDYMKVAKIRQEKDTLTMPKEDRYELRTSPQIEVIRMATHSIEMEINSVNDNPLIDVASDMALHGSNFQGTPIGVSLDNLLIAISTIGKLMFDQFSELVCAHYNNGLPSNLSGWPYPSLDGLKGAEIAMADSCSELQYLANPVTSDVQDVNSLLLISTRKCTEAVEILKLMSATYIVALCEAVDLRHLEENMRDVVKRIVLQTSRSTCYGSLVEMELSKVIEDQPVFSYLDDPTNDSYPLMRQLRKVLVEKALEEGGYSILNGIPVFEEELKKRLWKEVPNAWESFDCGDFLMANRIENCRTYPIYEFVRKEVGTELLSGGKKVSPGESIEKVYEAIGEGKLGEVVMNFLASCGGSAGPFTPRPAVASPVHCNPE